VCFFYSVLPFVRWVSEAPEDTTTDEVIVLAGFAGRREREIGLAGPEVAPLTTDIDRARKLHIEPNTALEDTAGR
jgi:hypothetical protein